MSIVRLEFAELPPEVARRLAPRVERLGYLGEFFRCAAHAPAQLAAFIDFTEAAKDALAPRLVEVAALTVAGVMANAYERNQHERLCLRLGYGRDWVAAVNALDPGGATLLSDDERAIQALVLAVLADRGRGAGGALEAVVQAQGATAAMSAMMVVGRYVTHALMVNALDLAPPVPSIFEDGFEP